MLEPHYPKGEGRGQPPIGQERMLPMYMVQQCFGLSDEDMKAHIGVGADSGLVHTVVTTAANTNDVTQAHVLLHGEEAHAFGDAGNTGVTKSNEHQGSTVTWHVAMKPGKRRLLPDTPLAQLLEKIEQAKASVRAKLEHPFHVVKNLFKHRKARYRGLAKSAAQLLTLFGLANLVLAKRRLMALHAQSAS